MFAGALAALAPFNGAATSIFIDASLGAPIVPTGAYNLKGVTLFGLGLGTPTTLTFQNGATISQPWAGTDFLNIVSTSSSAVESLANGQIINLVNATNITSPTSPFFSVQGASNVTLIAGTNAVLGDGTHPIVTTPAGSGTSFIVGDGSTVAASAVTGAGTYEFLVTASALGVGAQPLATGIVVASSFTSLARGWADNPAAVPLTASSLVIITSVTITPGATGKFRVIATGTFVPGALTTLGFSIAAGGVPSYALTGNNSGAGSFSGIPTATVFSGVLDADVGGSVDLPQIFPLGVPVTFSITATTGTGAGGSVVAHGAQLSVQEIE
jgi:hypothetical protein